MSILLNRRRPRPTPLFTTPSTTSSTTTLPTTTTTQPADIYHDYQYDYHYYDFNSNSVGSDDGVEAGEEATDLLTGCPGSLRDCLDACSPVVSINQAAYKICVNECLDRC